MKIVAAEVTRRYYWCVDAIRPLTNGVQSGSPMPLSLVRPAKPVPFIGLMHSILGLPFSSRRRLHAKFYSVSNSILRERNRARSWKAMMPNK